MEELLVAEALSVRRGSRRLLADVALVLRPGALVHLAGSNGSGKTSLIRVLAGLARPAGGTLRRGERCAFVPERVTLTGTLRVGEWLTAMRALRGLPPHDWDAALVASGLPDGVAGRAAGSLSKGMAQRVALVEALAVPGGLLLLDEPFSGLDAAGADWLRGALEAARGGGAAVLLTDHTASVVGASTLTIEAGALNARTASHPPASVSAPPAPTTSAPRSPTVARSPPATAPTAPRPPRSTPGPPTAMAAAAAPGTRTLRARHPDGRTLAREVAVGPASDALLRELLDAGWHVEALG